MVWCPKGTRGCKGLQESRTPTPIHCSKFQPALHVTPTALTALCHCSALKGHSHCAAAAQTQPSPSSEPFPPSGGCLQDAEPTQPLAEPVQGQQGTDLFMLVSFWSQDCSAVRLFPDRSRPPLPVYVKEFPWSCKEHPWVGHSQRGFHNSTRVFQPGRFSRATSNKGKLLPVFKLPVWASLWLPERPG